MIRIKKIKQEKYMIIDAILTILVEKGRLKNDTLRYELLKCGIMANSKVISDAIEELKEHNCIDIK